jgi:hypothetical protein
VPDHSGVPLDPPTVTFGRGRKGLIYEWHDLYVTAEMAGLDAELLDLLDVTG